MPYVRKTEDQFAVQGFYSSQYGWEDVCCEANRKEARERLKEYRENERGTPFRLIKRRIKKATT